MERGSETQGRQATISAEEINQAGKVYPPRAHRVTHVADRQVRTRGKERSSHSAEGASHAVQVGWNGVDAFYTRLRFQNCRLLVLNFSQPRGTPSTGIVCSGLKDGKMLHIDFEDCTLMGFKVFGTRAGEVSYTTKGSNKVYVEFEQTVPKGFERLGLWPVETFESLAPPKIGR